MRAQWERLVIGDAHVAAPRWARSSVFWQHGHPLRVMEAFAPWVTPLSAHDIASNIGR